MNGKILRLCLLLLTLNPAYAGANTLNIGVGKTLDRFFPHEQKLGESDYVRNFVSPPVVAVDDRGQWICIVCKKIPTLENGLVQLPDEDDEDKRNDRQLADFRKVRVE